MKFSQQCSWKKALTMSHEVKWQQSRKTTGGFATSKTGTVGRARAVPLIFGLAEEESQA